MTFEKLPSGSYRVRMTFNGKRYSAVFDHKPTEAEAMLKFSEKVNTIIDSKHITFETAAHEYFKLKYNVLSPSTRREYKNMPNRLSKDFIQLFVDEITALDVQAEVNALTVGKRPKTVKNYYGFITAVMRMYRPDFNPRPKLPQGKKKIPYIPNDEEVKKLFDSAKNDADGMFYIPVILGSYGLRRSEICALDTSDIVDNVININKGMVQDENNKWIIKEYPKNDESNRLIPIPESIANMINEQGYIYKGHPNSITDYIDRFCKKNDVQHFSLHKLRHYFCSRLSAENIDVETIIALSGHKTDYVMTNIYRHPIDEKVKDASSKLNKILFT